MSMIDIVMVYLTPFLERNGFTKHNGGFANEKCIIRLSEQGYEIEDFDPDGGTMYHEGYDIYWLIGILTYRGLMYKNYIN